MLKSITTYPNTATEVQAFYFYHRTKEAVIQQAALASFASDLLAGSELGEMDGGVDAASAGALIDARKLITSGHSMMVITATQIAPIR